jgi:hypothetical protein
MLTGQRFKLRKSALAIEIVDGMRLRVTIPTRTILKVIAGPIDGDQMVDVLWEGKRVSMFAVDLITRGAENPGPKGPGERLPTTRYSTGALNESDFGTGAGRPASTYLSRKIVKTDRAGCLLIGNRRGDSGSFVRALPAPFLPPLHRSSVADRSVLTRQRVCR